MEYLIAVLIIIAFVLVIFLMRKRHKHYVLVSRNASNTVYQVVRMRDHKKYLLNGESRYVMSRSYIIDMIKNEKKCFYTYSESKMTYTKVIASQMGYLTTLLDDVKDNNINSLKIIS